jgi:hypothetical protein
MIDAIDVRCEDGRVEIGLFLGEECVQVLPLDEERSRELRRHLGEAIEEAYPSALGVEDGPDEFGAQYT